MIAVIVSVLLALCAVAVDGQQSTPDYLSSTSSAAAVYAPTFRDASMLQPIISTSSNTSNNLWIIVPDYQQSRTALVANWQTNIGGIAPLTQNYPGSAPPPVFTRIRATSGALLLEDAANSWIAVLSLSHSYQASFKRSINVFGYQTFQVSPDAKYLAIGGVVGAHYIDFIDIYDLQATSGDGYLYRIPLLGLESRGFTFDIGGPSPADLAVVIGVNNTISKYSSYNGAFLSNIEPVIPDGFNIFTIASIYGSTGNQYAFMDCSTSTVAFYNEQTSLAPPSSYGLTPFNPDQCSESLTTMGPQAFGVLNSTTRMAYFTLAGLSPRGPWVAQDANRGSETTSVSPFSISFVFVGVFSLLAIVVAVGAVIKQWWNRKHNLVKQMPEDQGVAFLVMRQV